MPEDATDVLTSNHLDSLTAVVKHAEKSLKLLEAKAKKKIKYFEASFARLDQLKDALAARIEKLRPGVGKLPRGHASFTGLVKELAAFAKETETESKKEPVTTYFFGTSKVGNAAALESKVKAVLPAACKGKASQAVNDLVAGKGKDASGIGSGGRHASAGTPGVGSCTVFWTTTEKNDGLETVVSLVGVGSHKGSSSYDIHWSSISKLKVGTVFKL